jgi:hypothetical protein
MAGVMREDTRFWPLLTDLASCLCAEIAASQLPEPCFCGILPGGIVALDYCEECDGKCGMAWVRLTTITELRSEQVQDSSKCTQPLRATVEVGIARCAPTGDESGPPTMAEQLDTARLLLADQAAVLRAIRCCTGRMFTLGTWTPMGPQGGCVGGAWTVTFEEA